MTAFADVADVLVMVVERMDSAHCELIAIRDDPVPLSGKLLKQLEERDAAMATLTWLLEREGVPETLREKAEQRYREELVRANRTDDALEKYPVDEGILAELDEVDELLRRRRLTLPEVDAVLRGAFLRTQYTG